MTWLVNLAAWGLAISSLLGLAAASILFFIFHLGLRDFQEYEGQDG